MFKRALRQFVLAAAAVLARPALAEDQPVAIFHAFNQSFSDVEGFVCDLADQGYSHLQIPPAQKSSTVGREWYFRYQPVDFGTIEGRGSEAQLASLIRKAHGCHMKIIADVVFNHMTSEQAFAGLDKFPGLKASDFHQQCPINYNDNSTGSEVVCWLNGDLPDLKQEEPAVRAIAKKHLKKLLDLGIDGFRFDAAKHLEPRFVKEFIDYIDQQSHGKTWNYLEVIEDHDTRLENYNWIAAVTDFRLYNTLTSAFGFNGDLRALRVAEALNDSRSITFGGNHDTRRKIADQPINNFAINPCDRPNDASDCHLAGAYALARESGTPLILNDDNLVPYIPAGVKFRQIMQQRGQQHKRVRENVLSVIDSRTLLVMERGEEGFFVVNKSTSVFNAPVLDLTLTNLEGCYRELRNNFAVAIERDHNGRKFITRWGTPARGGMEVQGRDALYFIREPASVCQ